MKKAERDSLKLGRMRWLCFIPSALMFAALRGAFGTVLPLVLGAAFGIAFYVICSRGRILIISDEIVKDIKESLERMGFRDSVFEVKNFNLGLVVRVYLIQARNKARECNKAILDRIDRGWYKKYVWITQIVDLEEEKDVGAVQRALNEALIKDIRERAEKKKDR